MPCQCRVSAESVPCQCRVSAVSVPSQCRVSAVSVPSCVTLSCVPCPCRVSAVLWTNVFVCFILSCVPCQCRDVIYSQLRAVSVPSCGNPTVTRRGTTTNDRGWGSEDTPSDSSENLRRICEMIRTYYTCAASVRVLFASEM